MRTAMSMVVLVIFLASCAQTTVPSPAPQQAQVQPPSAAQQDIGKVEVQEPQATPQKTVIEPEPLPETHVVTIQAYAFSPKTLTIRSGDKVTWRNLGKTQHEIMGQGFQSVPLFQNDEYAHIFTQKGNYTYNSARYPATIGKVVVR